MCHFNNKVSDGKIKPSLYNINKVIYFIKLLFILNNISFISFIYFGVYII